MLHFKYETIWVIFKHCDDEEVEAVGMISYATAAVPWVTTPHAFQIKCFLEASSKEAGLSIFNDLITFHYRN